jgi:hypothetical protein
MAALIAKVDCFIFDCDGVIWRGDSVIEGVPETLDYLRSLVRGVVGVVAGRWVSFAEQRRPRCSHRSFGRVKLEIN